MTDYICPNCRGGFPDPEQLGECPWCGQAIDGSYEVPETPQVVSTVKEDTEDQESGVLGTLFGWD